MIRPTIEVTPDMSVRRVLELMVDEHAATLPVVDQSHHVCGGVSAHELLALYCSKRGSRPDAGIRKVTGTSPPSISASETIDTAASLFRENPLVDALSVIEAGEVVGILSLHNLLQALSQLPATLDTEDQGCVHGEEDVPDPCIYLG